MTAVPAGGLVDVHAHVFAPATRWARSTDDLAPAERDEPVERLWETVSAHGVSNVVLVPLADEDEYIREALDRFPGRFAAVACATDREHGITDLDPRRALRERRALFPFAALRTRWLGDPSRPIHESPMFDTFRAMVDDDIVLWTYLPPEQLGLLEQLVHALPELKVVLNHLGFTPQDMQVDEYRRPYFVDPLPPDRVERVLRLSTAPQVQVMISGLYALSTDAPPYRDLWGVVRALRANYGPERLMWGSDYPWPREVPGYRELISSAVEALGDIGHAELEQILGGNARTLFANHFTPTTSGARHD